MCSRTVCLYLLLSASAFEGEGATCVEESVSGIDACFGRGAGTRARVKETSGMSLEDEILGAVALFNCLGDAVSAGGRWSGLEWN